MILSKNSPLVKVERRLTVIFITLILMFSGCEEEPVMRDYPRIRTQDVTNITSSGATFTGDIYQEGTIPITDHGFLWSVFRPGLGYSDMQSMGTFSGTGVFTADISTALKEGEVYRVCAYLKAGEYTVYGNEVTFTSQGSSGPVITGFEPAEVKLGDTITIKGWNFSWIANKVAIDDVVTLMVSPQTDTVLKAIVPYTLTKRENVISVEVSGNKSSFTTQSLIVNLPQIETLIPASAFWGDTLAIKLINQETGMTMTSKIGTTPVSIAKPFDGEVLKVIVPGTISALESPVSVTTPYYIVNSLQPFRLSPPVINKISPVNGGWLTQVTIYGKFNPSQSGSSVYFGTQKATIVSYSKDSIKVSIPSTFQGTSSTITYNYGSLSCESEQYFSIIPPEVYEISPMEDYAGGIVTITGNYFNPGDTKVFFGDLQATVISVTGTVVMVYVPGNRNEQVDIRLLSGSNEIVYPEKFTLTNPVVTSFTPVEGFFGDTIAIECQDFNSQTDFVYSLSPGSTGIKMVKYIDGNSIRAIIPTTATGSGYIGAYILRNSITSLISNPQKFEMLPPVIDSISPVTGNWLTDVTIYGKFNPNQVGSTVLFGTVSATILSYSINAIRVRVPSSLNVLSTTLVYKYGTLTCESQQTFTLDPPELGVISSLSDYAGGIVTLSGMNFNPANTTVKFNDLSAKMISVTGTEAKFYVPGNYSGLADIVLTTGGISLTFPLQFMMTNPEVVSFTPESGTIGDLINIVCNDYNSQTNFMYSYTSGQSGILMTKSVDGTSISAVIPNVTANGYITAYVSRNGVTSYLSGSRVYTLSGTPVVTSMYPTEGGTGTEVTLTGSNFSEVKDYNKVRVNGTLATVTEASSNQLKFIMPTFPISGAYTVTVTVGIFSTDVSVKFNYVNAWRPLPDLPFTAYHAFAMRFGTMVLVANSVGTDSYSKQLYIFNETTGTFSRYNDKTYSVLFYWPAVIEKENKAYLLGYNTGDSKSHFGIFDKNTSEFSYPVDYPGNNYWDQILVDGDSVLYAGGGYVSSLGYNQDFWKYNPSKNRWTKLADLPGEVTHSNEYSLNGKCYVLTSANKLYVYDPLGNSWTQIGTGPGNWCRYNMKVESDGVVYKGFSTCYGSYFYKYDPSSGIWTNYGTINIPTVVCYFNFSLDSKIYFGGGNNGTKMWQYDPNFGQ